MPQMVSYTVKTSATTGGIFPFPSAPTADTFQLVSGLGPGHHYQFVVTGTKDAVSGAADSIQQNTKPGAVSGITFSEVSRTSVKVTWMKPDGIVSGYIMAASWSGGGQTGRECGDEDGGMTWSRRMCDLRPGVNYTFTITTVSGTETGDSVAADQTLVPLPPAACNITTTDTTTISISITANKESEVSRFFVVYKDENNQEMTVKYEGTGPHHKDITGLTPGTNYTFSTVAESDGAPENSTSCNNWGQTRLGVVSDIQISATTEDSLTVTYVNAPYENDQYRVRCYPDNSDNGNIENPEENTTICHDNPGTSCVCGNLTPGQKYKVEVSTERGGFQSEKATNGVGQTDLSKAQAIAVRDQTETSLTINVTAGPGNWDNFTISCEPQTVSAGTKTTTCTPLTTCQCTGLTPGEKYSVNATTVRQGFTDVLSDIQAEDVTVPRSPVGVNVVDNQESNITITWSPPAASTVFHKYIVYRQPGGQDEGFEITDTSQTTTTLTGMDPNTEYSINITAVSQHTGSAVRESSHTTASGARWTLPLPPTYKSPRRTKESLTVSWGPHNDDSTGVRGYMLQFLDETNACIQGVRFSMKGGEKPDFPNGIVHSCTNQLDREYEDALTLNYVQSDLNPFTNYSFTVYTLNPGGLSRGNPAGLLETDQAEPNHVPAKSIAFEKPNATSLTISWAAPTPSAGRTWYNVKLWEKENTDNIQTRTTLVDGKTVTFGGLSPYWDYTVEIQSETSAGVGPRVTKTDRTADSSPEAVVGLSGEQAAARQMTTVTWKAPEPRNQNGLITEFIIKSTATGDGSRPDVTHIVTCPDYCPVDTDYSVNLAQIKHSSTYTITVRADTAYYQGTETNIEVLTTTWPPDPPTNETTGTPTQTIAFDQSKTTTTTLDVNLQCEFFTNQDNGPITERGLIINYEAAGAGLSTVSKVQWKDKHNKYKDRTKDGGAKWRWKFEADPECGGQTGRRRLLQTSETFSRTVGTGCTDADTFCNGPLTAGTQYTIQSYACTNSHCQMTSAAAAMKTDPGRQPGSVAGIVAPIVVILCLALVIVAAVFYMRRRNIGPFRKTSNDHPERTETRRYENVNPLDTPAPYYNINDTTNRETIDDIKYESIGKKSKIQPTVANEASNYEALVPPSAEQSRPETAYTKLNNIKKTREESHEMRLVGPPRSIPVNNFPGVVKEKMQKGYFEDEFSLVELRSPDYSTTIALFQENNSKNRDLIFIPYDHSRVMIQAKSVNRTTDYINASFISGERRDGEYIATQSPLKSTAVDFWWMVWEQNVEVIVNLQEPDQKLFQYWPHDDRSEYIGPFSGKLLLDSNTDYWTKRVIELNLKGRRRSIIQYEAPIGFPPNPDSLVNLVMEINKDRNDEVPILVHCSNGCGKTGVFIGLDRLIQQVYKGHKLNVYNTVLNMREQRPHMVADREHYIFLHQCLASAVTYISEV